MRLYETVNFAKEQILPVRLDSDWPKSLHPSLFNFNDRGIRDKKKRFRELVQAQMQSFASSIFFGGCEPRRSRF